MPRQIVLDTNEGNVIKVDGECYILGGTTSSAVTHSSTTGSYSTCNECQSSSSSSSSSSGGFTPSLSCAGGTEPSMVLTITAPDVDLPISWCGKTWVKSTETPGVDEAYSGVPQEVCPGTDLYKRGQYIYTGFIGYYYAYEQWKNDTFLMLRKFGIIATPGGSCTDGGGFQNLVIFLQGQGILNPYDAVVWTGAAQSPPCSGFAPAGGYKKANANTLGVLSTGNQTAATWNDYRIQSSMFGSYVTGNVTYTWAKGTNW